MTTITPASPTPLATTTKRCASCPVGHPELGRSYCSRDENARHRASSAVAPQQRRRGKWGTPAWEEWEVYDWRLGAETDPAAWVPARWVPAPPAWDGTAMVRLEPQIPIHPDYSDCCDDFGCCTDLWEKAGMADVRDMLVGAAAAGGGCVLLVKGDAGEVRPLSGGPGSDEVL